MATTAFTISLGFCSSDFSGTQLSEIKIVTSLYDEARILQNFSSSDERQCTRASFRAQLDGTNILSSSEKPSLFSFDVTQLDGGLSTAILSILYLQEQSDIGRYEISVIEYEIDRPSN